MRFLASHLRLFHTTQPWRELPVAIGFPRGCYAMSEHPVAAGCMAAVARRSGGGRACMCVPNRKQVLWHTS